jgi:uncharacterized protein YegJ (DUF2314 family)
MLRAFALALPLALPATAEDQVLPYSEGNPRMNAAMLAAQETLPKFLAVALDEQGVSRPGAVVKVAMPTQGDPSVPEHIWVTPFARLSDGRMTGYLDNEPQDLGDLHHGDQVTFATGMISDWGLLSERGLAYGQFTTRVIFEDGAFGDTPFDAIFEDDPVPSDWR